MAVPKRRQSSTRRDKRRAQHDKIDAPTVVPCPKCSAPSRPHRVCSSCGYYKGREVFTTETAE